MCAVRNAPSRLLSTPTVKEKVQQHKPFARQTTVLFLRMDLVPHANAAHYLVFCFPLCFVQAQSSGKQKKQPEKSFRLRVADGQDSLISGAEMLAFESGACSVTEGHRAHNVCGAERTFEPVADTNGKRKTLLNSRVLALVEATGLEPVTSRM